MKRLPHLKSLLNRKKLPGFSLIELAIVLIIVGLIAGGIFKGQDLLESAKIRSVLSDIQRYRTAVSLYHDAFGYYPGDDPQAQTRFGGDVSNGNGDGLINNNEINSFWTHLAKAGHVQTSEPPSTKLGGKVSVKANPRDGLAGNWFVLGSNSENGSEGPLFTPKQASLIKSKADDGAPNEGVIRIVDGKGAQQGQCIKNDGHYNLQNSNPACTLLIKF